MWVRDYNLQCLEPRGSASSLPASDDGEVKIQHGRRVALSLFVAAAPPLHGRRTLRAVPFPLGSLGETHAAVVEPLDGTLEPPTHTRKFVTFPSVL